MKNKLFIALIIIIALIIGTYFIIKKPATAPTPNDAQNQIEDENLPIRNDTQNMEEMSNEEMMNHEQQSPTGTGESISKFTVNYTDSGFSPSSIEIKKGQTVQFVNKSNGGMWVASGPHPVHTAYPEFDAQRNIPSGEIYEFTFDKIGEWEYHNHTKAGMFGAVIVK